MGCLEMAMGVFLGMMLHDYTWIVINKIKKK